MKKLSRLAGKAGWSLFDQGLSALSNVLLSVMVARTVDAPTFGAFSVVFVIFTIAIAVSRALVGQPLQIRYSAKGDAGILDAVTRAHGFALIVGLGSGLVCLVIGAFLRHTALGLCLMALGVTLAGLLIQDAQRLTYFALGRASGAALIDSVRNVLLFASLGILIAVGVKNVGILVLAWGGSAWLAAWYGMIRLGAWPSIRRGLGWIRETRSLTGYLIAEYVLGLGASQVSTLLVGFVASQTAVGSLRAAQTLLGPLSLIGAAAVTAGIPEVARRPHLSPQRRLMVGHGISSALALATGAYVLVMLVMPNSWGVELFGDSWAGASDVILPMGLSSVFSCLAAGLAIVLYGLGRAEVTFRINMVKAPIIVIAVLGGAWWAAAPGAAWAMAFHEAVVLPLWYIAFRRAAHKPPAAESESSGDASSRNALRHEDPSNGQSPNSEA